MFKNTSGQSVTLLAFADAGHASLDPGEKVTGDAANITCKVEQDDDGTLSATGTTNPTETEDGQYRLPLTQAEVNGDKLNFYPESSTAGVQVVALPSNVIYTRPANFPDMGIESDGHVHGDLKEWLGTAPLALDSQKVQTEAQNMRGTDDALLASNAPTNFSILSIDGNGDVTAENMRGTDGASTHSAADVWAVATRTLSEFTFEVTTDQASRDASKADVSGLATAAELAKVPRKDSGAFRHERIGGADNIDDVEIKDAN